MPRVPFDTSRDVLENKPPNLLTIPNDFLNPSPIPPPPCAIELLIRLNTPPRLDLILSDCPSPDLTPAPAEPVAIDD